MSQPLKDKIILLTGASRHSGFALAHLLARAGAQLLLNARTIGGLEQLDDEIQQDKSLHRPTLIPFDLQQFDQIDAMGAAIYQRFGRLDGAILYAGFLDQLSPVGHISPQSWDKVIATNLTANYRLIRSLDPLFKCAEKPALLGITDDRPDAFWGHYHASKAGFSALLQCYRAETAENMAVDCYIPEPTQGRVRKAAYPGESQETLQSPEDNAQKIMQKFCSLYENS